MCGEELGKKGKMVLFFCVRQVRVNECERGCNEGENKRGKVCVQGEVTSTVRRCRTWQRRIGTTVLVLLFFKREGVAAFLHRWV